jgi:predicted amidophosphoribosyltransferase
MNLTRTAELFYDAVLTLAYPQACAICGASVERRKFGVVCETCWKETRIFTDYEALCWKCGLQGPACGRCESLGITAARPAGR